MSKYLRPIAGSLTAIIIIAASFSGGYLYRMFTAPVPEIKIVEKTRVQTRYIRHATTCDEYRQCYQSPIMIQTHMVQARTMHIRAYDDCKEARQDVRIKVGQSGNWRFYLGAGVALGIGSIALYKILL